MTSENNQISKKPFAIVTLRALKHLALHNGLLKVIAVVISVVLWAGLVSQDESLTRDKNFQNVNVSVTGTDTMKRNGFIVVSDLDELLSNVSIVAAVPQKQFENAEASAYNVRVDLSRINGTGEQELKLLSTNSTNLGKVVSTNPSTINVMVEDYIIRPTIPVSVSVEGEVPEGWYMSAMTVEPDLVAVSGPRSLAATISRARVYLNTSDLEWVEGTDVRSAEIKLYNPAGDEIISRLLTTTNQSMTIDSALIETTILPQRTYKTSVSQLQISGKVAKGHKIADVKISPEYITVAAKGNVLEQLNELPMEQTINVSNLSETTVFQLKVQKPSEEAVISNDTVTVTVVIEETD